MYESISTSLAFTRSAACVRNSLSPATTIAVNAIGSNSCASTPCVQPRRNDIGKVSVANTATSTSGRLFATTSVVMPSGVRRARPALPSAAPSSEWQTLSIRLRALRALRRDGLLPCPAAPVQVGALGFVPEIFSQHLPDVGFRHVLLEDHDTRDLVAGERLLAVLSDGVFGHRFIFRRHERDHDLTAFIIRHANDRRLGNPGMRGNHRFNLV